MLCYYIINRFLQYLFENDINNLVLFIVGVKDDKDVVCELILTIATLTVRNELCLVVEEAGGLKFILDAMVHAIY